MLEKLKQYYKQVAAVVGVVLGYVLLKQYFQKDLKADLINAKTEGKDAVLDQKLEHVKSEVSSLEKANEDAKSDLAKHYADLEKASNKEIEEYYKKN